MIDYGDGGYDNRGPRGGYGSGYTPRGGRGGRGGGFRGRGRRGGGYGGPRPDYQQDGPGGGYYDNAPMPQGRGLQSSYCHICIEIVICVVAFLNATWNI